MSVSVNLDVLQKAFKNDPLGKVGDDLIQTKVDKNQEINVGSVKIALQGDAEFFVSVFNESDDKDSDAVYASAADAHLSFDAQEALLKYKLSAKIGASAEFEQGLVGAAIAADRSVSLLDYRRHKMQREAFEAVIDDIKRPRTILDLDDVRALQPGEALAMKLGGSLSGSVTLSWSDAISTTLGTILSEIPGDSIAVKFSAGVNVEAGFEIEDEFAVVISRTRGKHFRFSVKKAKNDSRTFGVKLSAGFEINAKAAAKEALEPVIASIAGATKEQLASGDPNILAQAAQRLGVTPDKVDEKLAELRDKLLEKMSGILTTKVKAGIAYEYARIQENSAIADYILLDESLLAGDHKLALHGSFDQVADLLRSRTDQRELVTYLNERSIKRTSAYGFSLGIGKLKAGAKLSNEETEVRRVALGGFEQYAYAFARKYQETNIPQNDFEWVVDLKAEMPDYAQDANTSHFDYGLHLVASIDRNALAAADAARILDFAAMWGVGAIDPAAVNAAVGRKGTLRVQLQFEEEELRQVLARVRDRKADPEGWARAVAAAIPFHPTFEERQTFTARQAAYSGACRRWMSDAQLSRSEWLSLLPNGNIRTLETTAGSGGVAFLDVRTNHPNLTRDIDSFVGGAEDLQAAINGTLPPRRIVAAYNQLQELWQQRLYVAACGFYLVQCARELGMLNRVSRTLQVELDDATTTVTKKA